MPFAIISGIITFGLVSTTMLITTNVNSTVYKTLAILVEKLPNKDDDTNNTNPVTSVASPIYFPMPRHGFDKVFYEKAISAEGRSKVKDISCCRPRIYADYISN